MATPQLENLTESLQRYMGVQQLQPFEPADIVADALARLTGERGNIERILALWNGRSAWPELVDAWDPGSHEPALLALREMLDASLVVQRSHDGTPKTLLPFSPRFVTSRGVGTVFRDMGRSVVEGLWGGPKFEEIQERVREKVAGWPSRHPIAILLEPLCRPAKTAEASGEASLAAAIASDPDLTKWVETKVRQDWLAWLDLVNEGLAPDEQLETLTSLLALHLHVATLWRLGDDPGGSGRVRPCFFVEVEGQGQDASCSRAANGTFGFWRERAGAALQIVAARAVDAVCKEDAPYRESLVKANWGEPRLWCGAEIQARKGSRATAHFRDEVGRRLTEASALHPTPEQGEVRKIVVDALADTFGGQSSPLARLKDFFRKTGARAGIVGPGGKSRKRYLLSEEGIDLLVRLHAHRDEKDIESTEEEKRAVGAFIDDIADRYGIVLTADRSSIRELVTKPSLRRLAVHLPSPAAMRRNVDILDRRLDALRLVRRYSDSSSIIYVSP